MDEHFLLFNKPLVEKNIEMEIYVSDMMEEIQLIKLGDFIPLKKVSSDYFPEIHFSSVLFENLLNFKRNEYVDHIYLKNNDIIYNARKFHFEGL